eukprot:CAMPEP_0172497176 /NCGR_PEP_ID=MMETSP1066-20121228/96263_1 /TAXON_ID=671091 /ORGANISM="Coscinodiscus wailesii, Strain CCMP2513" /LENGTH=805 /DNA_ID=CAMNT_0013269803 /DNA_START=47 /DNA_END=2464 /DNA_ORIENTATION=+
MPSPPSSENSWENISNDAFTTSSPDDSLSSDIEVITATDDTPAPITMDDAATTTAQNARDRAAAMLLAAESRPRKTEVESARERAAALLAAAESRSRRDNNNDTNNNGTTTTTTNATVEKARARAAEMIAEVERGRTHSRTPAPTPRMVPLAVTEASLPPRPSFATQSPSSSGGSAGPPITAENARQRAAEMIAEAEKRIRQSSNRDVLVSASSSVSDDETSEHKALVTTHSSGWTEGERRVRTEEVERKMRYLTFMAAIGGFLFGYDTGVISGAMLPIKRVFDLTEAQEEIVVSCTILAAFGSSLAGGWLNNALGRRVCILIAATVFTVGSGVLAVAWSYGVLVLGRVVVGVGIGIASLTTPIYIAEMAKPDIRGKLVTVNALFVVLGQFGAGMIDGIFGTVHMGWRFMLGLAAIPSLTMLVGFLSLPESPRWLVANGKREQAKEVLMAFRASNEEAINELIEIVDSNHLLAETSPMANPAIKRKKTCAVKFGEMMRHAPTRRALVLGCGLMLLQQLSGINTVMYYAASIYEMSQFNEITSIWLSGFTALAQVLGVFLSIFLIDRAGRRCLVLTSLILVTISLLGLGASFYLARMASDPVTDASPHCESQDALVWNGLTSNCYDCVSIGHCGYCGGMCTAGDAKGPFESAHCGDNEWIYTTCPNAYGWMSVVFMVVYLLSFGIGMGGLPWTINSEIYPLEYRSIAVSISTATNWIGNFIVSSTFLTISEPSFLTTYGAFWMFAAVAFIGLLGLCCTLPETKGKSLEEIEELFKRDTDADDDHGIALTEDQRNMLLRMQTLPTAH